MPRIPLNAPPPPKGEYLSSGCFGSVYVCPENPEHVVKTARMDGTFDWIMFAWAVTSSGGPKDEDKWMGIPEVYAVGVYREEGELMWWARMKRYQTRHEANGAVGEKIHSAIAEQCTERDVHQLGVGPLWSLGRHIHEVLSARGHILADFGDLHSGNWLWDPDLERHVLTDPSSGSSATADVPVRDLRPYWLRRGASPRSFCPVLPNRAGRRSGKALWKAAPFGPGRR